MSQFWLEFLEFVYMQINTFIGYDSLISSAIIILFVVFQFWMIKVCIIKPFIDCFKMLWNIFFGGGKDEKVK